ncbi:unnamed protein product [Linum trigynum]|uniref:Uncharacterized protein n=1 Tax=Linum trigynum TaxID=586398 RepID=A0AAV2DDP4_9ROSI
MPETTSLKLLTLLLGTTALRAAGVLRLMIGTIPLGATVDSASPVLTGCREEPLFFPDIEHRHTGTFGGPVGELSQSWRLEPYFGFFELSLLLVYSFDSEDCSNLTWGVFGGLSRVFNFCLGKEILPSDVSDFQLRSKDGNGSGWGGFCQTQIQTHGFIRQKNSG